MTSEPKEAQTINNSSDLALLFFHEASAVWFSQIKQTVPLPQLSKDTVYGNTKTAEASRYSSFHSPIEYISCVSSKPV